MKMLETVYLLSVSLLSQLLLTRPRPSKLSRRCLGCKVFIVISHLRKGVGYPSLHRIAVLDPNWKQPAQIGTLNLQTFAAKQKASSKVCSLQVPGHFWQTSNDASMHRCMYHFQSLEGSRRVVAQVHGRQKKGWRQSNWRIQGIHRFDACVLIVIREKTAGASCCCWWWWLLFF